MEIIRPIQQVPYYAQFQDIENVESYINGACSLLNDPYWKNSGAETVEEYAYWANRACGMVCVKTCIEAFGGPEFPLHTWIQRGLDVDAYLVEKRDGETSIEKGWLHAGLAKVMNAQGLQTKVKPSSTAQLVNDLRHGNLVIASVSFEIGTHQSISHQGGHLVTVIGAMMDGNQIKKLYIHNPSGRTRALRENAAIDIERFEQAFSGRVITVKKV